MATRRTPPTLDDLRWLLGFATDDLNQLPPGALFDRARQLNAFMFGRMAKPSGSLIAQLSMAKQLVPSDMSRKPEAIRMRTLQAMLPLQRALGEGLERLVAGKEWELPGLPSTVLVVDGKFARRVRGTFEDAFVVAVADVLRDWWSELRTCASPGCKVLFVADDPRQKYHSQACGQKAQWGRFAPKRKRDYRREYEARVKRKTGPNVRPKRRR